jgi:hypothetical protein
MNLLRTASVTRVTLLPKGASVSGAVDDRSNKTAPPGTLVDVEDVEPSVVEALTQLGGVATRAQLVEETSRREVDAAIACGDVVVLARGRYALASVGEADATAHRITATLCLESAAVRLGWGVKSVPERPHVSVTKGRKLTKDQKKRVEVHRFGLAEDDVDGIATSKDRTLVDCLRELPVDRALAVADSALRTGMSKAHARAVARDVRGPHAVRVRRLVELATPDAANPFESVLRSIVLSTPGLAVRPQVPLRRPLTKGRTVFLGRPDLVDERLRIILEADSFEWHGKRAALAKDARRYNWFEVDGWLVLRFAWEQVMFDGAYVQEVLEAAVAERTQMLCPRCRTAS